MKNEIAISIENIGKRYRLGYIGGATLREDLGRWWQERKYKAETHCGRMSESTRSPDDFWALRNINLEVPRGEVLGLIGRNGAGKSTLLKILSRITAPTTGKATIRGRVGSLLEVGTGFHPELTGRENVYLNGTILGMRRMEIKGKFDAIVEFAQMSRFIDTPVKRYSSGMTVKLAFAVAAHLEPEILLVDEVLAVGDAEFQSRCIQRMRDIGNNGATVLVVSHSMALVHDLCRRVCLIADGTLQYDGDASVAIRKYLATNQKNKLRYESTEQDEEVRRAIVEIVCAQESDEYEIRGDEAVRVRFTFEVTAPVVRGRLAILISDMTGLPILSSASSDDSTTVNCNWHKGSYSVEVEVPGLMLPPGTYSLTTARPSGRGELVESNVCTFTISELCSLRARDGRQGMVTPLLRWKMED